MSGRLQTFWPTPACSRKRIHRIRCNGAGGRDDYRATGGQTIPSSTNGRAAADVPIRGACQRFSLLIRIQNRRSKLLGRRCVER
jgi:hypothetical protein